MANGKTKLVRGAKAARPHREFAMSLQSGTQLGPYEILSQIGAGGMGEGYKARDTRLERFVAIKR